MKLSKNEIEVAEREDMTYEVVRYAGKFFAEVHFRGFHWDTFTVGNEKATRRSVEHSTRLGATQHVPVVGHPTVRRSFFRNYSPKTRINGTEDITVLTEY